MNKLINYFLMTFLIISIQLYSQEKVENKKTKKANKTLIPNSTQGFGDKIEFKNESGNSILTITDEGNNAGSITIPQSTPSTTTNKLYNELGILKFNGSVIGSGGGADSINQLADAKFDGSSLFIGEDSGINDDGTSNANTAIGFNSLRFNTTGSYNTANGFKALSSNATGNYNTSNGYEALRFNTTGSYNTANGSNALYSNTTGASNTANGSYALRSNTTGTFNTANGYFALYFNTTGAGNTANGSSALRSNTTGTFNTANGSQAQYSNTTGSFNTANGYRALRSNTTGDGNVALGYNAGYYETGSNKLYINNDSSSSPLIWGDFANDQVVINGNASSNSNNRTFFSNGQAGGTTAWYNDSDRRLKKNISTIENALEKVNKLRGVNYQWKDSKTHSAGLQMGFIAQEAEKVIPEVVDNSGDHYSMQYAPVTALLVEAVKEQNKEFRSQNTELTAKIKKLEKENENLKSVVSENKILSNRINMIEAVLNKLVQQKPTIKVTKK